MSKSNGALGAVGKIVTYILVVLLVLGLAGIVAYFALRSQGVTFFVEYNGERYAANGDGGSIFLESGGTYNFSVKSLSGDEVDYTVSVQSNYSNNFDFKIDGVYQQFYSTTAKDNNYSAVFGLQKETDGFSLTLPDNFTVERAVETQYGGDIELESELSSEVSYFLLTVVSGKNTVELGIMLYCVDGVTIFPNEIVF